MRGLDDAGKTEEDQCEIGYWVAKPYWGKGICTEAMRAVVEYCFNVKGFTVLWGDYFPENPASGKVMEKYGFVDTGQGDEKWFENEVCMICVRSK